MTFHMLAQDPREHRARAGVADVQREQDLLLAPEVLDRLGEERVDIHARHGEPLLGPGASRPEQAPRVHELVLVFLRQRGERRVASHRLPRVQASGARSGTDAGRAKKAQPTAADAAAGEPGAEGEDDRRAKTPREARRGQGQGRRRHGSVSAVEEMFGERLRTERNVDGRHR